MNISKVVQAVIEKAPALAEGAIVDDPTAVKKIDQANTALRTLFAVLVTAAVAAGWIPEDIDAEKLIMVLSGVYVAVSSAYSYVSQIITTTKLGLKVDNSA